MNEWIKYLFISSIQLEFVSLWCMNIYIHEWNTFLFKRMKNMSMTILGDVANILSFFFFLFINKIHSYFYSEINVRIEATNRIKKREREKNLYVRTLSSISIKTRRCFQHENTLGFTFFFLFSSPHIYDRNYCLISNQLKRRQSQLSSSVTITMSVWLEEIR